MKKWIYMTAATLALAACSNEELPNGEVNNTAEGKQVTVIATLPGTDSRVTLEDVTENDKNIIKVNWKESGETFTVMTTATEMNKDTQTDNVFTQTAGDNFTGTPPTSGQPYYAFYPAVDLWIEDSEAEEGGHNRYWDDYGAITTFSADKVPFDLMFQNGELNEAHTLMYATSEDGTKFDFHHLTAIVRFTLTDLPGSMTDAMFDISWENESSPVGVLDLTQTDVKAMYPTADWNSIPVSALASNGSCTFYAYLPPLAQNTTLNIDCRYNDEESIYICTQQVTLSKDVEAGKFYRLERGMTSEMKPRNMTAGTVEDLKAWVSAYQQFGKINLTLTADIDLTNADLDEADDNSNWPELQLFGATVDGGGHTLTGLKRHAAGSGNVAAMFASVAEGASVKNLHLRNVDFKSSDSEAAGIVVSNSGTVEGCSVSGSVESESEGNLVGGVVASNFGSVNGCYSTASVTGKYSVGGVVGNNEGTVTACYSTGLLTFDGEADSTIGGIVGGNYGSISSCYWDCTGATEGVGWDSTSSLDADAAVKVEGTTTWEAAMNTMNTALGTGFGWQYVANTAAATNEAPLVLQKNDN